MKIRDLLSELRNFDKDDDIVIRTQKGHELYGDIGSIGYYEQEDEEGSSESNVVVIDFTNEGYSPTQALGESKDSHSFGGLIQKIKDDTLGS